MKERLPEVERAYLCSLSSALVRERARALHAAGWSLASIAEAWSPPRQRSTIRAWVLSPTSPEPAPPFTQPLPLPSSSSSSSSSSLIEAGEKADLEQSASTSAQEKTKTKTKVRRRVYDPDNPKISAAQKKRISNLAPLARRYRARTPQNGTYSRANRELTDLCRTLYYSGTSVRELSLAAGVTYRAMARRVGR